MSFVDEEVANVMLYQKSLSAASRLMTAMDEALDVLINKTGLVGRIEVLVSSIGGNGLTLAMRICPVLRSVTYC